MRLDVGLPTEIVTAGSDSNVSVRIRLGVEAIQRNCYNETNNNNNNCREAGAIPRPITLLIMKLIIIIISQEFRTAVTERAPT